MKQKTNNRNVLQTARAFVPAALFALPSLHGAGTTYVSGIASNEPMVRLEHMQKFGKDMQGYAVLEKTAHEHFGRGQVDYSPIKTDALMLGIVAEAIVFGNNTLATDIGPIARVAHTFSNDVTAGAAVRYTNNRIGGYLFADTPRIFAESPITYNRNTDTITAVPAVMYKATPQVDVGLESRLTGEIGKVPQIDYIGGRVRVRF
ncbi:MAG: hypothetical protein ACMXYE_04840 [Candidatus Woesearchaeota archaeon]